MNIKLIQIQMRHMYILYIPHHAVIKARYLKLLLVYIQQIVLSL